MRLRCRDTRARGQDIPRPALQRHATALAYRRVFGTFSPPIPMGRRPRAYRKLCRGLPFQAKRAGKLRRHRPQPCPKLRDARGDGLAFRALSYPTRHVADWFLGCSDEACVDRFGEDGAGRQVLRLAQRHRPVALRLRRRGCATVCAATRRGDGRSGVLPRGKVHRGQEPRVSPGGLLVGESRCREAVLLLAGRGELEETVRLDDAKSAAWGSVRFLGVRDDICDVLQACDVFVSHRGRKVSPSRSSRRRRRKAAVSRLDGRATSPWFRSGSSTSTSPKACGAGRSSCAPASSGEDRSTGARRTFRAAGSASRSARWLRRLPARVCLRRSRHHPRR